MYLPMDHFPFQSSHLLTPSACVCVCAFLLPSFLIFNVVHPLLLLVHCRGRYVVVPRQFSPSQDIDFFYYWSTFGHSLQLYSKEVEE